jgi:hypothetical protein
MTRDAERLLVQVLAWFWIGLALAAVAAGPVLFLVYRLGIPSDSGIARLNRQLAEAEGRNPDIPPGLRRVAPVVLSFIAVLIPSAIGALATLRWRAWGRRLVELACWLFAALSASFGGLGVAFAARYAYLTLAVGLKSLHAVYGVQFFLYTGATLVAAGHVALAIALFGGMALFLRRASVRSLFSPREP